MGACNADDDLTPYPRRVGPKIVLTYERWHYQMPPNPPEWDRMGPNEQAEWNKARELVQQLMLVTHDLRNRGLLPVDKAYWVNLW